MGLAQECKRTDLWKETVTVYWVILRSKRSWLESTADAGENQQGEEWLGSDSWRIT